jgi:SAM-dependent methyltransferase
MRAVARAVSRALARALPFPLVRAFVRAWALGTEQQRPAVALRKLLTVYDDVYLRIDHAAIAYDEGVHAKHRLIAYHDFFVARVQPGERVLDVGCGKGELAHDLVQRAHAEVVGIDVNTAYLAFARERFRHPNLRFVEADALTWRPDGRFDVVVLSNVLEHIAERPALLRALRESTGAQRFLIRVPVEERDWLVPLRRELGLPHTSDPTHEIEYDEERFRAELEAAGLDVRELLLRWSEIWAEAVAR